VIFEKENEEMEPVQKPARAGSLWYYRDGGKRLSLKTIRQSADASQMTAFMREKIAAADRLPEPQRSQAFRSLRAETVAELRKVIGAYRDLTRHGQPSCANVQCSLYVATCYLRFEFAALQVIDEKATRQLSLF
tara:strand:- start:5333 stop:5734 length:402 start_codon:yes stop_codon:yes gene_type:complete